MDGDQLHNCVYSSNQRQRSRHWCPSALLRSVDNEAASAELCVDTPHSFPQTDELAVVPRRRRQTDAPPILPATHSRPAAVSEREWLLRSPPKKPQDTSDCVPIDRVPP